MNGWFERLVGRWDKQEPLGLLSLGVWVALLGSVAFFLCLGCGGVLDETEPLFAEAARQMRVRQDWVTPYFNDLPRFDKPPLTYWLIAMAYQLLGVNAWAVRLPSACAAIVLVAFVAYVLYRHGFPTPHSIPSTRWVSAIIGVALLTFNLAMLAWGRLGVSDMLLNSCLGGALISFFLGYAQHPNSPPRRDFNLRTVLWGAPQNKWYWLFYGLLGSAILAKGPIGLILPGLIIPSFLLLVGQLGPVWVEAKPCAGLSLTAMLTVPWYALVTYANGQAYIDTFFGYHNFERFTEVVNRHSAPSYFFVVVLLVSWMPWSVYLPTAIGRLRFWQLGRWRQLERGQQLGFFALCWSVVIFGFFTASATKLPSYILPLMPAIAIILALYWSRIVTASWPSQQISPQSSLGFSRFWWVGWLNALLLIALSITFVVATGWTDRLYHVSTPDYPDDLEQSRILWWSALLWGSLAIAAIILLVKRQGQWLWLLNTLGLCLFVLIALLPALMIVDAHRQQPLRDMAELAKVVNQPNEPIIMLAYEQSSAAFYAQKPIVYLNREKEALYYMQQVAQRPPYPQSFLILLSPRQVPKLKLPAGRYEILEQNNAYALIRIPTEVASLQPIRCEDLGPIRRPFWEHGLGSDTRSSAAQLLEPDQCPLLLAPEL